MKVWTSGRTATLLVFGIFFLMPVPGHAIPAFARKFGVKCYTCHTVPPALNKNGYMFKRLGYRMPPDEMDGTKPAPKISALDKDIKFSLTNSFAVLLQGSVTDDKNIAETGSTPPTTSSTTSSFNLDEAAFFVAGTVPETGFSYFGHYEMYQDGSNGLEQGFGVYTAGRANSSFFVKGGQIHMQEGEGTRAAMFYNLFPDPAYILTATDPIGFTLDQAPVGVDAGYTWASNYFKNVFAVSAKVTNGLDADGNEILNCINQEFQGCLGGCRLLVRPGRRRDGDDVSRIERPGTKRGCRRTSSRTARHSIVREYSGTTCSSTSSICWVATCAAMTIGSGTRHLRRRTT